MPVYVFVQFSVALALPGVAVNPLGALGAVLGISIVLDDVVLPLGEFAVTITLRVCPASA